jgi:hypothetical protein
MQLKGLNVPRLALQVRTHLKKLGITKLKVDRTTIYRLVNGKTKRPDPAILRAFCDILDLPKWPEPNAAIDSRA